MTAGRRVRFPKPEVFYLSRGLRYIIEIRCANTCRFSLNERRH